MNRLSVFIVLILLVGNCAIYSFWRTSSTLEGHRWECGHWSVHYATLMNGVFVPRVRVLQSLPSGDKGVSLLQIRNLIRKFNLISEGLKVDLKDLTKLNIPLIAHLKSPNHFIVIVKVLGEECIIADSDGEFRRLLISDLRSRWSGNVLTVSMPSMLSTSGSKVRFDSLINFATEDLGYPFTPI